MPDCNYCVGSPAIWAGDRATLALVCILEGTPTICMKYVSTAQATHSMFVLEIFNTDGTMIICSLEVSRNDHVHLMLTPMGELGLLLPCLGQLQPRAPARARFARPDVPVDLLPAGHLLRQWPPSPGSVSWVPGEVCLDTSAAALVCCAMVPSSWAGYALTCWSALLSLSLSPLIFTGCSY